jgi:hypothetical protein
MAKKAKSAKKAKNVTTRQWTSYWRLIAVVALLIVGVGLTAHLTLRNTIRSSAATNTLVLPNPTSKVHKHYASTKYFSWYFIDRRTGAGGGSNNANTFKNYSESMIKPGIVADYLRRLGRVPTSTELAELKKMIIYSNDYYAQKYYKKGGGDAMIRRIISICGLTRTTVTKGWWSKTSITAYDAAKYGRCIAKGNLAGSRAGFPGKTTATGWLLATMRQVWGSYTIKDTRYSVYQKDGGRWGIISALGSPLNAQVSIKNGWTYHGSTGRWSVNCLAIHKDWVLAIEMQTSSKAAGAYECKQATRPFIR